MLHVTTDLQTKLQDLEHRMGQLVRWRDETVRQATLIITKTNREFDKVAVPLGREINDLRDRLQLEAPPTPAKPAKSHKAPQLTGLDDDEKQHFLALRAKRGKK